MIEEDLLYSEHVKKVVTDHDSEFYAVSRDAGLCGALV